MADTTYLRTDRGNSHDVSSIDVVRRHGQLKTGVWTTDLLVTSERNGIVHEEEWTLFHNEPELPLRVVESPWGCTGGEDRVVLTHPYDPDVQDEIDAESQSHAEAETIRPAFKALLDAIEVAYRCISRHADSARYSPEGSANCGDVGDAWVQLVAALIDSDYGRFVRKGYELRDEVSPFWFLRRCRREGQMDVEGTLTVADCKKGIFMVRNRVITAFEEATGEAL